MAVLYPIYQEEIQRVLAGLEVLVRTLRRTEDFGHFDFYILSDSREANSWVKEELLTMLFARDSGLLGRLFYRRRVLNQNSKSGNVSDWLRKTGRNYDYMLILDADSIMSGESVSKMLRIMEHHPKIGILQTQPNAIFRETMYGRLQQFSGRLYGPLYAVGLSYIQLGHGHYIGHNAILRVDPFIRFCGLPILPGCQPFGGHVLSHDFLESALMAKHGWEVWYMPEIEGSYEEVPPTLLDELKRERRWAQGNLQHISLLFADRLTIIHRFLFLNGAMTFLAAPIWAAFLVFNIFFYISLDRSSLNFELILLLSSLPEIPFLVGWVILFLLFSPKVLAALVVIRNGQATDFGGSDKIFFSIFIESVVSIFVSPVKMLFHTVFLLQALTGSTVKWGTQRRNDSGVVWIEAVRHFWCTSLFGLLTWVGLYALVSSAQITGYLPILGMDPRGAQALIWLSPILGGMSLAVPIAVITSSVEIGRWLKRRSIFLIPEEARAFDDLQLVAFDDPRLSGDCFLQAVVDPQLNAIHAALQRPKEMSVVAKAALFKALENGPDGLSENERIAVLRSREAMTVLHEAVWRDALSKETLGVLNSDQLCLACLGESISGRIQAPPNGH